MGVQVREADYYRPETLLKAFEEVDKVLLISAVVPGERLRQHKAVIGREPTPMTADFNKAIREHDIDLAIVEGEIVGLIEICPQADHLWIENVAVHPHRQGIGIGRTLLAHVESKAAQAKLGEIRLQTNEAFEANIALYAALGYEIDRHEPFKGGTTVFMRKKL